MLNFQKLQLDLYNNLKQLLQQQNFRERRALVWLGFYLIWGKAMRGCGITHLLNPKSQNSIHCKTKFIISIIIHIRQIVVQNVLSSLFLPYGSA